MVAVTLLVLCIAAPFAFTRIAVLVISRRYPATGAFHDVNGVRLHVIDRPAQTPDAPTLVCVHGASGNARDPLGALESVLGGRYRLIVVDRPGHGHSRSGAAALSDPRMQADLMARLGERLGVDRAIVLGHSWGGTVATAFALRHPERTAGVVLVAPASHPWPGGVMWQTRLRARPVLGWLFSEALAMPVGLLFVDRALRKIFRPDTVPAHYRTITGAAQALKPRTIRTSVRELGGLFRHVVTLSQDYRRIRAPTAIVTGDADRVTSPGIHAYALARDIPGATLTTLPGVGHMPHWTASGAVAAAIDSVARRAAETGPVDRRSGGGTGRQAAE